MGKGTRDGAFTDEEPAAKSNETKLYTELIAA